MRILYAAAECAPLVRVGGLGEVAGGLSRALRAAGAAVEVVVPDYAHTPLADETAIDLVAPAWAGPMRARTGHLDGFGEITLVHVDGINRPHPYVDPATGEGWPDNDRRFMAFSAAVAALVRLRRPDVLHVNDWHTGAAPAMVGHRVPTVVSIHNLAYQGQCHVGWLDVLDDRKAAYERDGATNPLAGALSTSDAVIAVSPNYAREILTPAFGCGLEDVLAARGAALVGILNGIDTGEWNPATDPYLASTYTPADFGVADPATKARCRAELRAEMGLDDADGPVIGFVTRLVEQKGVDLAIGLAPYLDGLDAQLVVLGSGDPALARELRALSAGSLRVAFREGFDLAFAHRVFAGSDLYVMPSRFEPCGLAQMQAMEYGTIPVVTDVGGLRDTVPDADLHADGLGFVARTNDLPGMVDALHRATRAWTNKRRRMQVVKRGMQRDWSWAGPAAEHLACYARAVALHAPVTEASSSDPSTSAPSSSAPSSSSLPR